MKTCYCSKCKKNRYVAKQQLSQGSGCTNNDDCISGYCLYPLGYKAFTSNQGTFGYCTAPLSNVNSNSPEPWTAPGGNGCPLDEPTVCASGACLVDRDENSRCLNVTHGQPCTSDNECEGVNAFCWNVASGDNSTSSLNRTCQYRNGVQCNTNQDCNTYPGINQVCDTSIGICAPFTTGGNWVLSGDWKLSTPKGQIDFYTFIPDVYASNEQ